jgi:hypothetical protein
LGDGLRQKRYEKGHSDTNEMSASLLKRKKVVVGMPLKELATHMGSGVPGVGYAVERAEANYTRQ